jgi:hypothetical protein
LKSSVALNYSTILEKAILRPARIFWLRKSALPFLSANSGNGEYLAVHCERPNCVETRIFPGNPCIPDSHQPRLMQLKMEEPE